MSVPESFRLQPLRAAQILDRAINIYRRNFSKFIGIFSVVQVPVTLLTILVNAYTTGSLLENLTQGMSALPEDFWARYAFSILALTFLGLGTYILVMVVGAAALAQAVTDDLTGEEVSISGAYRRVARHGWGLLRAAAAMILLNFVALVLTIFIPCLGWIAGPSVLAFLGLVITPLFVPAAVIERQAGLAAVRRAWELARRRFWPVAGFAIALYLLSQALVFGPSALVSFLLSYSMDIDNLTPLGTTLNSVVNAVAALFLGLLINPLRLTAFTLLYYDLRVRTEGLDLALQAGGDKTGDAELSSIRELVASTPAAGNQPWLTSKEIGNFTLASLVVVGFYVLLTLLIFFFILAAMQWSG